MIPSRTSDLPLPAPDRAAVRQWLEQHYPELGTISVHALASWLRDPQRRSPVLLDIRSPVEHAVSRLPGARTVTTPAQAMRVAKGVPRGTPIVVYCAVGVRAARLAKDLLAAGRDEVLLLDGSIFDWAQAGLPLVGPRDEPVAWVHPFDERWGVMLRADLHAR